MPRKLFQKAAASNDNAPRVLLGIEGGGSWGAFAWGVLEVLEEETFAPLTKKGHKRAHAKTIAESVKAVSGTSAGAKNAVGFVSGMEQKRRGGVKRVLGTSWSNLGKRGDQLKSMKDRYRNDDIKWPNLSQDFYEDAAKAEKLRGRLVSQFGIFAHMGPYGRLKSQPEHLRDHITDGIKNWDAIRESAIKLCVGATRLVKGEDGEIKEVEHRFGNEDVDADAIAASGAVFASHEKDGEYYVDGAKTKNPVLSRVLDDDQYDMTMAIMVSPEPDHVDALHEDKLTTDAADGFLGPETYSHLAHEVERGRNVQVIKIDWERVRQKGLERGFDMPETIEESSKMNFCSDWVNLLHDVGREMALEYVQAYRLDNGVSTQYKPNKSTGGKRAAAPELGSDDLQGTPEVA